MSNEVGPLRLTFGQGDKILHFKQCYGNTVIINQSKALSRIQESRRFEHEDTRPIIRDILESTAIRVLASQRRGLWPGSSIDARLEVATGRLKSNLTWESLKYPEITCKGYDTYIVLKWLVEEATMQDCGDDFLASALWAADSWLRVLSKAEMFLTEAEELHKFHVGNLFLKSYLNLAVRALEGGKKLYRLKPKFHLLYHLVNEKRPSRLNCTLNSTWMDEDAMKKWMRISRMVHKRTAAENVLRRFVLGFHTKLRSAKAPQR